MHGTPYEDRSVRCPCRVAEGLFAGEVHCGVNQSAARGADARSVIRRVFRGAERWRLTPVHRMSWIWPVSASTHSSMRRGSFARGVTRSATTYQTGAVPSCEGDRLGRETA